MVFQLWLSLTYSNTPPHSTRLMPSTCGLCGSSAVSHFAWCLRWIAAHSLVTMPVVSHSQNRKKCDASGCSSSALCLAAVQIDGNGRDGDLRKAERDGYVAPPREIKKAFYNHLVVCCPKPWSNGAGHSTRSPPAAS